MIDLVMGLPYEWKLPTGTEYPKIDTAFARNLDFTVDPTRLKNRAISAVGLWHVYEKIDGMNIRVVLQPDGAILVGGRTNKATIPGRLLEYLQERLAMGHALFDTFSLNDEGLYPQVVLYGEGYGAGIQKGGYYCADQRFRLFDIKIDGWWLDREKVETIADSLGVETVPMLLGNWGFDAIIQLVRQGITSVVAYLDGGDPNALMEGVIAHPVAQLYDKWSNRVMMKVKTRDFTAGKE